MEYFAKVGKKFRLFELLLSLIINEVLSAESFEIVQMLVDRARKGEQQSMYRLYRMYVRAMYNVCIRIVANQLDAEDILQESFASALGNLKAYKGEASFDAWLKRIVINQSIFSTTFRTAKAVFCYQSRILNDPKPDKRFSNP